jgi:elongation factor P
VFGPILFIGAMAGGSFRAFSDYLLPGLTGPRGSYAVVGLGAFLAAATHAPLTCHVPALRDDAELRGRGAGARDGGDRAHRRSRLQPDSIDTLGLTAEGKSLHAHPERLVLERIPVGNVYQRDVETIPERAPLPDILRVVGQSRRGTFPVVDDDGRLVGVLSFAGLRSILLEDSLGALIVARDLCDPHVPTLTPESTLAEAFRRVEADGLEDVPVVDPADPRRLLGMLSRADLIGAYNRTVATLGALPMSAWLGAAAAQPSDAYRVLVVNVPRSWVGQTLRQIDCRRRYGITVLAVHPAGHDEPAYCGSRPRAAARVRRPAGARRHVRRIAAGARGVIGRWRHARAGGRGTPFVFRVPPGGFAPMLIPATQLRVGMIIMHQNDLWRVMQVVHVTPGNWRGMVQTKLRNLRAGTQTEYRFRSEDKPERVTLEQHDMEYLYESDGQYHFMNTENYEQIALDSDLLGDAMHYVTPNSRIQVEFHEGKPMGISLPKTVDLKVMETAPGLKTATVTNALKPATTETVWCAGPQLHQRGRRRPRRHRDRRVSTTRVEVG